MNYKKLLSILFLFTITVLVTQAGTRNWIKFNDNWKFIKGNPENAQAINFDDSSWETVNVPHDWAIKGPFNPDEPGNTGQLPWKGEGWYRKTFQVEASNQGKIVYFLFDGIMSQPKIYINGKLAGQWDYGYNSFYVDVTKYIKFGEENTLAVHADTRQHGSRWYPGAGIYRKVRMLITDPVHTQIWGTYIQTPVIKESYADLRILSTIENRDTQDRKITVRSTVLSPEGIALTSSVSTKEVKAGRSLQFDFWPSVTRPVLWNLDNPVRYSVKTEVMDGDKVLDTQIVPFGIRTFKFTANNGFFLNGKHVQIQGVNLHADQGPLGMAFNTRAMQRQLEIMKSMGCNAIRTSHNVCAPELVELCDKMGMLVFDEAFDKYDDKADITPETDFYEFGERNIRNFVMRDRNHPSVIIWSVGNEMGDIQSNTDFGLQKLAAMVGFVRKYDITRPVTMACDQAGNAKWRHFDYYDIHSWNYGQRWEPAHKMDPSKAVVISESASTVSTRSFYELPLPEKKTDFTKSNQVSSYDLNAPAWAEISDDDFMWGENGSYIAGEFVWTGFDYIGEPTPYSTSRSSYFGIVDLCGIPKDRYYLYQSHWAPEKDMVHILPHWNWKGYEGKNVPVFVYTNGDGAELFLNGKSLGKKFKKPQSDVSTERYRLMWKDVIYEPGELKAVAYKNGGVIGEAVVKTAGAPYSIKLTPDRSQLDASGDDLSYILVEAYDKDGNLCPLADNLINFKLKGPAEIAGVGNGNPQSHEPFVANYRKLFYGKAMLIIQTEMNKSGKINVSASSDGLKGTTVDLSSN